MNAFTHVTCIITYLIIGRFARLNMYHLMFFLRQYFAFHLFSGSCCLFLSLSLVACLMYSVVFFVFRFVSPFSLILLLISWVQIDSKKQPNWNRCCLNNSMRYIHITHLKTYTQHYLFACEYLMAIASCPNLVWLLLGNNMYRKLPDK